MADVGFVSAGTFVASILETAGFMTQAKFLNDFRDFFREAGAFIYILGAAGAIFSMAIYGSFRAARYLLLGPALFWFLVGPRSQTDGAIWQIGGGSPRTPSGPSSLDDAIARRDEVIRKATDGWQGTGSAGGRIEVATGFALFAMVIDGVANDLVDFFLAAEDGKDMTFIGKTRGYEVLTMVTPEDSLFVEMLEQDFMVQCAQLMNAAMARAYINIQESLSGTNASPEARRHRDGLKAMYDRDIDRFLRTPDKFIGAATARYIRAQLARPAGGGGSNVSRTIVPNPDLPLPNISCGTYWQLVTEYLISLAEKKEREIMTIAKADLKARAGAGQDLSDEEACREIQRVIYGSSAEGLAGACKLKYAIALYMLKNQIGPQSAYARLLKRHWNTQLMINPIRNNNLTPIRDTRGFVPATGPDGGPIIRHRYVVRESPGGQRTVGYVLEQQYTPSMADPNARPQEREHWFEVVPHSGNQGPDHAMWVSTQRAQTVNLRQQMFTWALQLPYWQGMILYLIASMYPFLALLVLIPGRASAFWNVPLAWLWAKSWDVGLAAVIVLDRVMWNMLPEHNLDETLSTDSWAPEAIVRVLTEAFKLDPGFNIHMYYMLLSIALLSIPVVSGAMTIRAKRSILSTFTDSLQTHSRDAGDRRSGAFQMQLMNERYADQMNAEAIASLRATSRGDGIEGGRRSVVGRAFAAGEVLANVPRAALGDLRNGNIRGLSNYTNVAADAVNQYSRQVGAQAAWEVAYAREFDPEVGRWGRIQMLQDAYASAMDGTGGYEIRRGMGTDQRAPDAFIDVFTSRAIDELKLVERAIGTGINVFHGTVGSAALKLADGAPAAAFAAEGRAAAGVLGMGTFGLFGLSILQADREDEDEVVRTQRQRERKEQIDILQRALGATEMSNAEFLWEVFFIHPSRTEDLVGAEAAHRPVDADSAREELAAGLGVSSPLPRVAEDFLGERIRELNERFEPRFEPPFGAPGGEPFAAARDVGGADGAGPGALARDDSRGDRGGDDVFAALPPVPPGGLGMWSSLTSWAYEPVDRAREERRANERDLFTRVGEVPIELPMHLQYLRLHYPDMADEAIEEYLRRTREQHAEALVAWNERAQEGLLHDEQFLYRLAKARGGRAQRDVEMTDIFGKRRRWKIDLDIEEV